jgi:hypothetical protein
VLDSKLELLAPGAVDNCRSHHTHDIEERFPYKRPEFLPNIARAKTENNYSSDQIFNAIRGVGTMEGLDKFEFASGASMTR